jgi:hypothetical protein
MEPMRSLTDQEISKRDKRRESFIASYAAGVFFFTKLLEQLGVLDAEDKLDRLVDMVPLVATWFSDIDIQTMDDEERLHPIAQLTFYLGELFVQKHDGRWLLDENPDSPTFLHYVIGQFSTDEFDEGARLDPALAAAEAFALKRPLEAYIENLERGLRNV